MEKKKYIYFAEVERFGYTLQCIGLSEAEVKEAMINEYVKAYKRKNGTDPRDEDEIDPNWGYHYFTLFLGELYVEKREINKVEWT